MSHHSTSVSSSPVDREEVARHESRSSSRTGSMHSSSPTGEDALLVKGEQSTKSVRKLDSSCFGLLKGWSTTEKVIYAVASAFVAVLAFTLFGSFLPALLTTALFVVGYYGVRHLACSNTEEGAKGRAFIALCAKVMSFIKNIVVIASICRKDDSSSSRRSSPSFGGGNSSSAFSSPRGNHRATVGSKS